MSLVLDLEQSIDHPMHGNLLGLPRWCSACPQTHFSKQDCLIMSDNCGCALRKNVPELNENK